MPIWKQSLLSLALFLGAALLAAAFVPAAQDRLRALGLGPALDVLGLAPAAPDAAGAPGAGGPPGAGAAARGPGAAGGPGAGRPGAPPPAVIARAPGEGRIADRVTAIGDGQAIHSVTVTAETPGRVAELLVQSGQAVQQGDILMRLDPEAEEIALDRARLVLDDAQAGLDRLRQLQGAGASTAVQLREAELALRKAELELRQAEFDLSQRLILAPVSGVIGILNAEVGTQITPTTEIARIDDRSVLLVDFRLPERMVGRIAVGDAVTAEALAGGFDPIPGTISAIDNRVDPASRTLRVQARLDNAADRLRAGMSFAIVIDLPGEAAAAVDPLSVQWNREGAFVWVVREGAAQRLPVRILQRSETDVLVSADFLPGDLVVVEGVQSVRPGAPVRVQGQDATATSAPQGAASL